MSDADFSGLVFAVGMALGLLINALLEKRKRAAESKAARSEALRLDSEKWRNKVKQEDDAVFAKKLSTMTDQQVYFAALAQILSGYPSQPLYVELLRRATITP